MIKHFILFILFQAIQSTRIYNKTLGKVHQKIRINEKQYMLGKALEKAEDVLLIHRGSQDGHSFYPLCQVQQKDIATETQEFTLILEEELHESDFDPDQPINLQQFVFMIPIKQGILAITSQKVLYILMFEIKESLNEKHLEELTLHHFTKIFKVLDFQNFEINQQDIPQLVYCEILNMGLLLYHDKALIFSIDELEFDDIEVMINKQNYWIQRNQRGASKVFKNFLFLAVGYDGLDIYLLYGKRGMKFLTNIQNKNLFQNNQKDEKLYIMDFSIVEFNNENIILYLMDQNQGIIVTQLKYSKDSILSVSIILPSLGDTLKGLIVAAYNSSIFAVYQSHRNYIIKEYYYDFHNSKNWYTLATYTSRTKILNVKINSDLAILQGINYHRALFYGIRQDFKYYSSIKKLDFHHGGLRDIGLLHQDSSNVTYMVGVTKTKLFLMKYKIVSPHLVCFTDDSQQLHNEYIYTVQFNNSKCVQAQNQINEICQYKLDLEIKIVQHFLFKNMKIWMIGVIIIAFLLQFFLCIYICRSYLQFQAQSVKINDEINEIKLSKKVNQSSIIQVNQSVEIQNQFQQESRKSQQ